MAKKAYLTNKDLLAEILAAKERYQTSNRPLSRAECISNKLASYIILLVNRVATRRNWSGYTWLDDMKAEAVAVLCANYYKFNEEKSDNPFAYFTTAINRTFLSYLDYEGKLRTVRDELNMAYELLPSYHRQERESKDTDQ